jgi:hypothetical protein
VAFALAKILFPINFTLKPGIFEHRWHNFNVSDTCVQRPPLGLKKVAIVQKWLLFRGWFLKITINIENYAGRCRQVAVVQRWSLTQV